MNFNNISKIYLLCLLFVCTNTVLYSQKDSSRIYVGVKLFLGFCSVPTEYGTPCVSYTPDLSIKYKSFELFGGPCYNNVQFEYDVNNVKWGCNFGLRGNLNLDENFYILLQLDYLYFETNEPFTPGRRPYYPARHWIISPLYLSAGFAYNIKRFDAFLTLGPNLIHFHKPDDYHLSLGFCYYFLKI